jgi:adenylate cyclase
MTERNTTVLVVDDDQLNRTVLTKLLEHEGYQACAKRDGTAALEALENGQYDAMLLDIVMPGLDGIAVLKTVKTSSRFWRLPVIMISAVEETASIVRCLELGAEDYVLKPFDPVLLRARINACLARRRFQDLEGEYHKIVEEQALELDRLYRLGRFFPASVAKRAWAGAPDLSVDPHRQLVAVVAGSLEGFGALADTLDPDAALRELAAFHGIVGALAGNFEATMGPAGPKAVSLFFNDPVPCDDPPGQAVRLALRCRDEVSDLTEHWNVQFGHAVSFGMGVALGPAVLGPVGVEPAVDYAAVGHVVDRAHNLCRQAVVSGLVLCDQAVVDATGGAISTKPLDGGHEVVGAVL